MELPSAHLFESRDFVSDRLGAHLSDEFFLDWF